MRKISQKKEKIVKNILKLLTTNSSVNNLNNYQMIIYIKKIQPNNLQF